MVVLECTGDGRGDETCARLACWGTAGALSRLIKDFLNHDGLLVRAGGASEVSLVALKLMSECFRPSSFDVEDFGRRGSTASIKYS